MHTSDGDITTKLLFFVSIVRASSKIIYIYTYDVCILIHAVVHVPRQFPRCTGQVLTKQR